MDQNNNDLGRELEELEERVRNLKKQQQQQQQHKRDEEKRVQEEKQKEADELSAQMDEQIKSTLEDIMKNDDYATLYNLVKQGLEHQQSTLDTSIPANAVKKSNESTTTTTTNYSAPKPSTSAQATESPALKPPTQATSSASSTSSTSSASSAPTETTQTATKYKLYNSILYLPVVKPRTDRCITCGLQWCEAETRWHFRNGCGGCRKCGSSHHYHNNCKVALRKPTEDRSSNESFEGQGVLCLGCGFRWCNRCLVYHKGVEHRGCRKCQVAGHHYNKGECPFFKY